MYGLSIGTMPNVGSPNSLRFKYRAFGGLLVLGKNLPNLAEWAVCVSLNLKKDSLNICKHRLMLVLECSFRMQGSARFLLETVVGFERHGQRRRRLSHQVNF